jgi:AraC-like DNA-binding protein
VLGEDLDAAEASFRVGYESPSQFSREYRRLFGAPPHRDIEALRQGEQAVAADPLHQTASKRRAGRLARTGIQRTRSSASA